MSARILVVDDERSIRIFLKAILLKEGYTVEVATSGEDALLRLRETAYDLALVDLKLGAVDGLQVMAECRKLSPPTGVIVLTGHGSLDSAIHALRLGAADYLLKPCSNVELKKSVKKVLEQVQHDARARDLMTRVISWAQEDAATTLPQDTSLRTAVGEPTSRHRGVFDAQAAVLRVGDFLLDRRRRLVTLKGKTLSLTPTEYSLLLCLAENADCPTSCQEIVRNVYGYECHESDARQLVKLHVKNLRQKTEADPGNPRNIRNVRAVGYMLCTLPSE